MNADPQIKQIRICAARLWKEDGSLEGCEDEYWRLAKAIVENELSEPAETQLDIFYTNGCALIT